MLRINAGGPDGLVNRNAPGQAFPKLRYIFADRVYRGPKLLGAIAALGPWTIEIVTRTQNVGTFRADG